MKLHLDDRHGNTFEVELPKLTVGDTTEIDFGGGLLPVGVTALDGDTLTVEVAGGRYVFTAATSKSDSQGKTVELRYRNRPYRLAVTSELDRLRARTGGKSGQTGPVVHYSALPGVVRQLLTSEGANVTEGTTLLTLEAMKMENEVRAEITGHVEAVFVAPGDVVAAHQELVRIAPE